MLRENYSAWHITAEEFSENWTNAEKLSFFAKYAILAPSGHNTQPWRFAYSGQTLLLKADYNRQLPYSGIQANEPYVSLGACLGTLELAARGFGYKVEIEYILSERVAASVTLSKKIPADSSLLDAIAHRVSNRSYYETNSLPETLINSFTKSEFKNASTYLISRKDDIAYIADLTTQATHATMGDKAFRAELSKWVRNNATRQYDGMPGFVQGIPTPISMFAKHIIKRVDVSKDQAKKDSGRVIHSGNLVIITTHNSSKEALLDGGRLYAQICVLAQQKNVATTGVGAAIIDPATRKKIVTRFKLPGKPIAIIRLGKTNKHARHTPRWPLTRVTSV
jgi:hypothetical protein